MSRAGGSNARAVAGQLADDASEVDLSAELQVRTRHPRGRCRRMWLCWGGRRGMVTVGIGGCRCALRGDRGGGDGACVLCGSL